MKSNYITDKIILQREKEITTKQEVLERYQKNVNYLQVIITQKKDFLESYKKTLLKEKKDD